MSISNDEKQRMMKCYDEYCESIITANVVPEKLPARNNYFLCENHYGSDSWNEIVNGQCKSCVRYCVITNVDGGLLFLGKDVMSFLLTLKSNSTGKHENAELLCAQRLFGHWTHCNVYPARILGEIMYKVKKMYDDYRYLKKYEKLKKTQNYWTKYELFIKTQNSLFDIHGDATYVSLQEKFWGVTMTDRDKQFYEDQKNARIEYCTRNVDPIWRRSQERKQKRCNRSW